MAETNQAPSSLLQYLPALYQQDNFIGQFLVAFEKVLLGRQDGVPLPTVAARYPGKGLEEIIAGLASYFDPRQTPEEFLPWLAGWTALSVRADLPPAKQRDFISNIIQLYRWRGTRKNVQDLLAIFTIGTPTITEAQGAEFRIGVHSTVGVDTYVGGGPAHYFQVTVAFPRLTPAILERQQAIARALIDLEKPAHTFYDFIPVFPTMQIAVYSTVGVDTVLGSA